ncbi:MAG: hypothetical protein MHM6MM_004481 [Cercozoa sp. M6MM]
MSNYDFLSGFKQSAETSSGPNLNQFDPLSKEWSDTDEGSSVSQSEQSGVREIFSLDTGEDDEAPARGSLIVRKPKMSPTATQLTNMFLDLKVEDFQFAVDQQQRTEKSSPSSSVSPSVEEQHYHLSHNLTKADAEDLTELSDWLDTGGFERKEIQSSSTSRSIEGSISSGFGDADIVDRSERGLKYRRSVHEIKTSTSFGAVQQTIDAVTKAYNHFDRTDVLQERFHRIEWKFEVSGEPFLLSLLSGDDETSSNKRRIDVNGTLVVEKRLRGIEALENCDYEVILKSKQERRIARAFVIVQFDKKLSLGSSKSDYRKGFKYDLVVGNLSFDSMRVDYAARQVSDNLTPRSVFRS